MSKKESLYSYRGNHPETLPLKVYLSKDESPSGKRESRTSLYELSDSELESYGFTGPFTIPDHDSSVHKVEWTGEEFALVALTEEDLPQEEDPEVDYVDFWHRMTFLDYYTKLKEYSKTDNNILLLTINIGNAFNQAAGGRVEPSLIQKYINTMFLLEIPDLTDEDTSILREVLLGAHFDQEYTIPDAAYIANNSYDIINDIIV